MAETTIARIDSDKKLYIIGELEETGTTITSFATSGNLKVAELEEGSVFTAETGLLTVVEFQEDYSMDVGYTYFRLVVDGGSGVGNWGNTDHVSVAGFRVFESGNAVPVTWDSSGGYTTNYDQSSFDSPHSAGYAMDNDDGNTWWESASTNIDGEWIEAQLSQSVVPSKIEIYTGLSFDDDIKNFLFQGSNNGTDWTTILDGVTTQAGAAIEYSKGVDW